MRSTSLLVGPSVQLTLIESPPEKLSLRTENLTPGNTSFSCLRRFAAAKAAPTYWPGVICFRLENLRSARSDLQSAANLSALALASSARRFDSRTAALRMVA